LKVENIQHSTFNIQHSTNGAAPLPHELGVDCSMLNVECSPFRILAILSLVAFFCLSTNTLAAEDFTKTFDAANKFYEQGKFSEAASAYEKMIQSGSVSPALYFNLGNALFKSSRIGRAIAAYRQAEQLAPRDPDVRANLQFARNQIQGPTLPPSRWQRWLGKLTVNEWTMLASVALWLSLLSLMLMQIRPALKPSLRSFAIGSGIATVMLCACLATVLFTGSREIAIVTAHEAAVRSGPLDESQSVFTAHDGEELAILDAKDDWLQVNAGQRLGWLKREQVLLFPEWRMK
jgi:tetratricopeptide (TPR) repeat protein